MFIVLHFVVTAEDYAKHHDDICYIKKDVHISILGLYQIGSVRLILVGVNVILFAMNHGQYPFANIRRSCQ